MECKLGNSTLVSSSII